MTQTEKQAVYDHITGVCCEIHDRLKRLEKAKLVAKDEKFKQVIETEINFFHYLNYSLYAIQNCLYGNNASGENIPSEVANGSRPSNAHL